MLGYRIRIQVFNAFIITLLFPYLHLGCFFPASDGISLKGELILSNDSPAVFVPNVGYHIHVRGPHLKLSLPVNDGGQGSTDQKGTFGVALR